MKCRILVTGATGFIGRNLIERLVFEEKFVPIAGVREMDTSINQAELKVLGDLKNFENFNKEILEGFQVIIHTAARAHIADDDMAASLIEHRKINVDATLNMARQAAEVGVKRFIFISSIGVNGSVNSIPFTEEDKPGPIGHYARFKWEAEQGLKQIAKETDMEVVIIRPPLVYGRNAPGNFGKLFRLLEKGLPLPLGAINNRRSFVGTDNLVDFIVVCIDHPAAANQTFLVADGVDISTTFLLKKIAKSMKKSARLIPVSPSLLDFGAKILGKKGIAQSLLGSLQVDITKSRNLLGWEPPVSVDEGLRRCVERKIVGETALYSFLRFFDIIFSAFGLLVCLSAFALIMVAGWLDTGSPLFFQERVGKQRNPFTLVKFRTMKLDTASVASHLASLSSVTKIGSFLRKTKLDELPQLWNVLKGEMSLVGPRPCLFNQEELIRERDERGVYTVRPGITGLAQVNGIDMSTPKLLAETDAKMIQDMSLKNYFMFILQTIMGKGFGDKVKN